LLGNRALRFGDHSGITHEGSGFFPFVKHDIKDRHVAGLIDFGTGVHEFSQQFLSFREGQILAPGQIIDEVLKQSSHLPSHLFKRHAFHTCILSHGELGALSSVYAMGVTGRKRAHTGKIRQAGKDELH